MYKVGIERADNYRLDVIKEALKKCNAACMRGVAAFCDCDLLSEELFFR